MSRVAAFVVPLTLFAACGEASSDGIAGSGGYAAQAGDAALGGKGGGTSGAGGSAGTGATDGGDAGAGGAPPPGNALLLPDGSVVALYPVSDPSATTRAVAFVRSGVNVRALDEAGNQLWQADVGDGDLGGGFDFDADGWPDLAIVRSAPSGVICGADAMLDTWLDVARGINGQTFALLPKLPSICWTFPTATYPTQQWTASAPLFGSTKTLVAAPYYAKVGTFWQFDGAQFQSIGQFQYPSTPIFDSTYTNDKPNAWGSGQSHLENSHVANGLVLTRQGVERAVFFTSGRVVQYRVEPESSSQLLLDTPYLSANRTDLAGRNYGLVAPDPASDDHVVLIAGTGVDTLFNDMLSGEMTSDPNGGIERHVTIYDLATGAVDDRFFSTMHDNTDGNQYVGRVATPDNPFVRSASGPSRLAFNVYDAGHWFIHVTAPGSTADAITFKDKVLWDIVDLDSDGVDEWVVSPSRDPSDPDVPGYYFVKWRTELAHFDAASLSLDVKTEHAGVIPYMLPRFRAPNRTSSRSFTCPVSRVRTASGLALVVLDAAKAVATVPIAG